MFYEFFLDDGNYMNFVFSFNWDTGYQATICAFLF